MKKIQNMLKLKPEAEKLNLSFLQIESLDDIIYELYHFDNLKEVDLSCNRIRKMPVDLSVLKSLERIDLTNNLFDNIEQVLTALNTIPNLKEVNINLDQNQLKNNISHYLPNIDVFNGEVRRAGGKANLKNPVVRQVKGEIKVEKPWEKADSIHDCFMIYEDELANLRLFHQNVYNLIKESTSNPKSQTKSFVEKIQNFEDLIKSAYEFNSGIEDKLQNNLLSRKIDTYFLKKKFLSGLVKAYNALIRERNPKIAATNEQVFQLFELLFTNVESKYSRFDDPLDHKPSENVKEEVRNEAESNDTERTLLKLKLSELELELEDLRKENDDMYKFLVNSSKKEVVEFAKRVNKNTYGNPLETRRVGDGTAPLQKTNNLLFMKSYTQRQIADLTLDILSSKKAFDEKLASAKQVPETLENYLFVYFQQKYGLKELIFVEVSSVVERIKSFANKSVEIETFRRILKNEIDELFFWHLQNLKTNFKTKLEDYCKDKVKRSATASEAAAWAAAKINGKLTRDEADHLLAVSFKNQELKLIRRSLKVYFDENAEKVGGDDQLSYALFFEFILDHELNKHATQITTVADFFNKQDELKTGFINRKQFLNFLDLFAVRNISINPEAILAQADPFTSNKITFSRLIETLISNFSEKDKQKNLLLQLNTL